LDPALSDYDDPALEYWNLEGSNVGLRSGALASGIKTLLNEVRLVADKSSKRLRPLRPNDIALLCRTHDKAAACANALSENGVPVSLSKEGLLSTPEAYLGIACLRYMVDPTDTLAIAEIIVLSEAVSPEDWLEDRLEFLSKGLPSTKWGLEGRSSSRLIESLNSERKRLTVLSPVEAVEAALQAGEVEKTVQLWGPVRERSMQRLANLEALRGYASEYEDYCLRQKSAATAAGFILWVNNLASEKLDKRGRDDKVAAVQVLTHHAAKGLEWPVVIAADLDTNIREGFWGANIFSETASFDFHNPLADRMINYWVKPFGQQAKGISVYDKIADSTLGQNDRERQLAESKRLLYVSFTRARDLLILPLNSKAKSHPWLDSLSAGWLTQENGTFELPSGNKIHCLARTLQASELISPPDPADNFFWFSPKAGKEPFLPATKTPSSFETVSNAKIGEIIGFGSRVPLNGAPKMNEVGDAIHGCLAMEFSNTGTSAVIEDISRILERHGLQSQLDGDGILSNIVSFRKTLSEKISPKSHYAEWPIQMIQDNGQIVKGWIDLVLETKDGWVIVDHKSFPGSLDEMKEKALGFSGQLQAYKKSIEAATNKPVLNLYINYMMTGKLVEVII
jgi:ATP-dependent exoDNAse (exonuclease V) beta subunit